MLEKKANINATTKDGSTVLHIAAHCCEFEIVKYLIEMGVDFNVKDSEGNTPLHLAVQDEVFRSKEQRLNVVKHLIEKGADNNTKNSNDQTAADVT